ncbi:protein ECERIFERUM 16 [Diospyros lotus]|uniref:protein ECERIFERUM 16 n=1 Tax=Diospyros lotus TaxID=55363 RepID=UPI00225B2A9C|nr:protein ECERIFERUM 16 [Diospyros lotus]XP_052178143.1 protein ECERIFERUM 16 [Diospyros lotus]XP_052178144.1 protein ECERIFERUM 16 [Diospyros lotus]XP_052178145.1 protein ECERIFERUM 16 [Diospyros lotus]
MDVKAMAKSKRAHSQHHNKKHHPSIASKAPSAGAAGANSSNKSSGKQVTEKPDKSRGSRELPSNWSRYEEEYDSGSEGLSHNDMSQAADIVTPKSKGADYGHLVSEATSQSHAIVSSESFPSFDDVLSDSNQGFGSLLTVRGQSILSWTGDDNFIVEDRATASHGASFLSLNLNLLAEQLAKVDLPERLFMEPDLLPPELSTKESETSFSQESDQVKAASRGESVKKSSDQLASHSYHDTTMTEGQISELMSPNTSWIRHSVSTSSAEGLKSTNQVKNEPIQPGKTRGNTFQYKAQVIGGSGNSKKKCSGFEGKAAEAEQPELDMLLESPNETNFYDSSVAKKKSSDKSWVQQEGTASWIEVTSSLEQAPDQPSRKDTDFESASFTTNFDDALDDLLKETSSVATNSSNSFLIHKEETSSRIKGISSLKHAPQPSGKDSGCLKQALDVTNCDDSLDDLLKETSSGFPVGEQETSTSLFGGSMLVQSSSFDQPSRKDREESKSAAAMANLDGVLDDLLEQTSNLTDEKTTAHPDEVTAARLNTTSSPSSGPAPKSKVLDDFDSWFNTINGP